MLKVNEVNLKPASKEYLRQKRKTMICMHLKELEQVDKCDAENDEIYSITCCSLCGHEMSYSDMKKRVEHLKNFKK